MKFRSSARLPLGALVELLVWVAPATAFILYYVHRFNGPMSSIAPHLMLVGVLAIGVLGLRLALALCLPRKLADAIAAIVAGSTLSILIVCYAVILTGLLSWGRIPTWPLIRVYAEQWRELMSVIGMHWSIVPAILSAGWAFALILVWWLFRRSNWPHVAAAGASRRAYGLAAFAAILLLARPGYDVLGGTHAQLGEPLQVSLHPEAVVRTKAYEEPDRPADQGEALAASQYQPSELKSKRNVIIIVGDALRADRLSILGADRKTTPFLDQLNSEGRVAAATAAQAICTESFCGLMGIYRSRFVAEFSKNNLNLKQVLALHGYRSLLIFGGDHTNFYGLAKAFGPVDLWWDGSTPGGFPNDDRRVIARARQLPRWDGTPTFMQFHLMSSHGLGLRNDDRPNFAPGLNPYNPMPGAPDFETRKRWAENYYDNGILQLDQVVRDLLSSLDSLGYLEDAVIVLTGDHGDMLGEHRLFAHAVSPFRPALEVPLILIRIGYDGPTLQRPRVASQLDIGPTILDELGIPIPVRWSGRSLHRGETRSFLFFQQRLEVGLFDLRDQDRVLKYWKNLDNGARFVFDALRDRAEKSNLVSTISEARIEEWDAALQDSIAYALENEETINRARRKPGISEMIEALPSPSEAHRPPD